MAPVNRRTILAGLFVAPFLGATVVQAAPVMPAMREDEHAVGQWRVRWMGWKEPVNQAIKFGYWFAYHETDRTRFLWVSTTLGSVQRRREFEQIDLSRPTDDWPISAREPHPRFLQAQVRAYAALIKNLTATQRPDWREMAPNGCWALTLTEQSFT